MIKLQRGDLVVDLDKEPEPSRNIGRVEAVRGQLVTVIWKDGTTSKRPLRRLGKFTKSSSYNMPAAKRKEMWDKILQMTDQEINAEIAQLERKLSLN
jgi:hypothetical protein